MLRESIVVPLRRDRKFYTSLALHRAVLEHLETDPERVIQSGLSGVQKVAPHTRGDATVMLGEWSRLLNRADISGMREMLTGLDEYAVEMRNLTPFLDVLSQEEREAILDKELRRRRWER